MTAFIGQPTPRVDGRKKVTGQAVYAAEVLLPSMSHAVLVGAAVASGRLERIDTAVAERAPGVMLVLTHANRGPLGPVPAGLDFSSLPPEARPPLADEQIRYYGQVVAMVVAETLEQARYAASLVDVRYRATSPVVSLADPRAVRLTPTSMMGQPLQTRRGAAPTSYTHRQEGCGLQHGDYPQAASDAEVSSEHTYSSPDEYPSAMEPHATVASWVNGELVVYNSTQYIDGDRTLLASMLQLAPETIRVVAPFVGGMFGSKGATGWHVVLASIAAMRLGRPVKVVLTRQQVVMTVGQRTASSQRFTLCASRDGTLVAMHHDTSTHTIVEDGHPDPNDYVEPTSFTSRMMYACPNYKSGHELVRVNIMKPAWMRAPGEALCMWALESAMDELAYELDLDPIELRRRNHADARPAGGKPFSNKRLLECYDRGAQRFGWAQRDARPGSMRDGRISVGWGMASATYPGICMGATVRLRLETLDGGVVATVGSAGSEVGQGAYTMMAMVTADRLGVPLDRVVPELGDSTLPHCGVTGGSSLTNGLAPAIADAAAALRGQLLGLAARAPGGFPDANRRPDDFEFRDGMIVQRADGKSVKYGALLALNGGPLETEASTPPVMVETDKFAFQNFGAQFVEVRVDRALGHVQVSRVVSVFDVGKVINPMAVRSQLIGGVVFGIGMGLLEGLSFDPNKGLPLNPDLAGYLVPVHADIPPMIDISWLDEPDYNMNSIGCRGGVGEIGITGVAAAIANAVFHATGIRVRDLPILPEQLL